MAASRLLIIVRHAQSEHHVLGLSGGWTDTPLTALGHAQAARVAGRLAAELSGLPIDGVLTSDLIRARQTAEPIAQAFGVPVVEDARLREHNNGEAAGLRWADALQRWPGIDASWPLDWRPIPGCETRREFIARCADLMADLHEDSVTLLVSHGGTISNLVGCWLQLPPGRMEQSYFAVHPTAVSILGSRPEGGRHVERLNDTAHLEESAGRVDLGAAIDGWLGRRAG